MGDEGANSPPEKEPLAVRESIKSGFETVKQLTTLSAGSTVLLATFLKDIFPGDLGDLTVRVKWTIVAAFLFFGLTLIAATISLVGFSLMLRSRKLSKIESNGLRSLRMRYRYFIVSPLVFYTLGLILFSFAVLDTLLDLTTPLGKTFLFLAFVVVLPVMSLASGLYYMFWERQS
jgi:hypothetical protein